MPENEFDLFKDTFTKYQELFGLGGYRVYFKHTQIKNFAEIRIQQNDMVATVILNSQLPKKDRQFKNVKLTAKHEAIHLLINRLEFMAYSRYLSEEEIYEAAEELVHKLEKIIPDICESDAGG